MATLIIVASYVSSSQFVVQGNREGNFPIGLPVRLLHSGAFADVWVVARAYDQTAMQTLVTIDPASCQSNLSQVLVSSVFCNEETQEGNLPQHTHNTRAGGGIIPAAQLTAAQVDVLLETLAIVPTDEPIPASRLSDAQVDGLIALLNSHPTE